MTKIRYKSVHHEDNTETHLCDEEEECSNLLETDLHQSRDFPKSVFFIIGNEFCERFSYYGLRTVLVLYFSSELLMTEDSATSLYHLWTFLCYFTTIFGAIMADSFTGRYKTIIYLSIVYLIGNGTLSMASIKVWFGSVYERKVISVTGLILIAFGTGGIKPCVSAFGGDQFELPRQESQLTKFFAFFYFSINAGSLLSTIVTPILREDVRCFGGDCFPLAFGVPASLMIVALVIFLIGTPRYKIVPPEGNVGLNVVKCIGYAMYQKISNFRNHGNHFHRGIYGEHSNWIDLASDKFSRSLITDVKVLLRVLTLYLPLPLFWALFEQQGSRWTFQAARMSGKIGSWTIKPDQMQVLNPLLIMLLIPFFDGVVYPWLDRHKILTKPLHRMFVGGLLAACAFMFSGLLQIQIENQLLGGDETLKVLGINASPCDAKLNFEFLQPVRNISRDMSSLSKIIQTVGSVPKISSTHDHKDVMVGISADVNDCQMISNKKRPHIDVKVNYQYFETVVLSEYLGKLELINLPHELHNPFSRNATIRIIDASGFLRHSSLELKSERQTINIDNDFFSNGISASKTMEVSSGRYDVFLRSSFSDENVPLVSVNAKHFSKKVLLMYNIPSGDSEVKKGITVFDTNQPTIHMMWILPQYITISIGEIMFSITGLEFTFKQAPQSMKSVVQAAWLLTTAFGNLIVVVIAQSKFVEKQSVEFFAFASLMVIDMIIFLWLANRFEKTDSKVICITPEDLFGSSESEEEISSF